MSAGGPTGRKRLNVEFWAVALLVAVGAAVVVVPLLLLRPDLVAPERRAMLPAPRDRDAVGGLEAGREADPRLDDLATSVREPVDATELPAPTPASGPVIERRRVQQGPESPARPPSTSAAGRIAGPPDEPPRWSTPEDERRAEEWDRSERARQTGLERFGGTPQTQGAVDAGLAWLAAHQAADGTWDRMGFDRQCPPDDRCAGQAQRRENDDLTAGVTGLALLAFLGAGYTDRDGPYPEVVRSAVAALRTLQRAHGGFSAGESMAGYNDALATLALAEYYALTRLPELAPVLERAVARLVGAQQQRGGWDYLPSPMSGRNDSSITAWVVQALHACAATGIPVPRRALVKAALHFSQAVEPDGRVRYADAGAGFKLDENMRPVFQHGAGMLAAGLTAEQMLGWRLDGPTPLRQRGLMLADPPSALKARGRDATQFHNEYYWYYGTLAMFQRGGEDWQRWNHRLRDTLLPLQNREKNGARPSHAFGSWPPYGPNWGLFGRMAGRVYTTAICTLTLEIYYRHTPAYLSDAVLFTAADWQEFVRGAAPAERLAAVDCLGELRLEVGEPVLVQLLEDAHRGVRLSAAQHLATLDSPMGVGLLDEVVTTLPPWERQLLADALARGRAVQQLPPAEGRVRIYDAAARRATLELPRSYVGMTAIVERAGAEIARLRVVQRFSGRDIVVAERLADAGGDEPQPADRVIAR